ncbi:hypothetical protein D3C72_1721480 [compost metagenome]
MGECSETRVCLHAYLVDAAKQVDVIYVKRAQVDLQSVEHFVDRHAQLLRLDAIHLKVQLRDVDVITAEQGAQLRCLCCFCDERFRRVMQRLVAQRPAIFELQLEAAEGAQA